MVVDRRAMYEDWDRMLKQELTLRAEIHPDLLDLDRPPVRSQEIVLADFRKLLLSMLECFNRSAPFLKWSDLCSWHYILFDLLNRYREAAGDPAGDLLRAFWKSIETVLEAYRDDRRRSGFSDEQYLSHGGHLPLHVIGELHRLSGFLAVGAPPIGLEKRGPRIANPAEREAIECAVAYRQACRDEGLQSGAYRIRIVNAAPIKTLAKWFAVDERTVQGWVKRHRPHIPAVQSIPESMFVDWVQRAGQRFQQLGRGREQHERRATKRKG